jgi:transcriptional regulator
MYLPAAFAEPDLRKLHDFIEQNSFGLLVSQVEGLPFATHLPFLLDRTTGPHGTLVCHVARANPQWREAIGQTALAIFSGPHAYVSPTWYEAEQVVPTWNYAAVHAYGRAQVIEDEDALLKIVQEMVRVYEQAMPQPWSFEDSTTFVKRLLGQIVGMRIEIEKIEGKFKLNQNHPVERRQKVVRALQQRGDENALVVAALIQERLSAGLQQQQKGEDVPGEETTP